MARRTVLLSNMSLVAAFKRGASFATLTSVVGQCVFGEDFISSLNDHEAGRSSRWGSEIPSRNSVNLYGYSQMCAFSMLSDGVINSIYEGDLNSPSNKTENGQLVIPPNFWIDEEVVVEVGGVETLMRLYSSKAQNSSEKRSPRSPPAMPHLEICVEQVSIKGDLSKVLLACNDYIVSRHWVYNQEDRRYAHDWGALTAVAWRTLALLNITASGKPITGSQLVDSIAGYAEINMSKAPPESQIRKLTADVLRQYKAAARVLSDHPSVRMDSIR
jgi:hypothetical protein